FAASSIAAAVLLDAGVAVLLTLVLLLSTMFVAVSLPVNGGQLGLLELARLVLVIAASSLSGLLFAVRADRLQRYLVAGLATAAAAEVALVSMWLLDADRRPVDLLWMSGASLAGGLLAATIAVGTFILLSRPFGIVTRVELMELSQLSHPLLRRLQDEAPGTFQHSVLVGNLAERAADRIGADPLLTRVGAYYHDIGKLVAPAFFVENAPPGESPHEGLDPLQSTRVIHQHVTAGVEIARKEGIPAAVVQFIPQHHGTRMASFFYRRAAEADPSVDPALFRYPGPKPQSREAALVMLADAAEASVRASSDHSAERIRAIIEGVIRERIEEGQFTECDISLRDLAAVGQSFTTALTAVYHPRIEYPAPTERERADRGLDGDSDGAEPAEAATPPPRNRPRAPRPPALTRERGEDDA
ncbi:MAG: HDIG domain-containing protein, partial [Dehalococcoidia bacterium]